MTPVRALSLALLAAAGFAADTYEVDGAHSSALFAVSHLNISTFHGRFNDVKGQLVWDEANPAASKITVTIASGSVDTNNEKRDQHLKNPDFFNAKQFPTLTFASTAFAGSADALTVTGDLTLAGTTKPVTVTVKKVGEGKDPWGGSRIGFDTTFTIKRSDFGIKGVPGVGDEVTVTFALEGVKK